MKAVDQRILCFSAALLVASAVGFAQNPPQNPPAAPPDGPTAAINSNDPRVGLKPGYRNAGVAAKNMELLANVPKPGPFEPKDILEGAPIATPDAGRGSAATPPPATPPATPEQPAAATAAPPAPPAGRGGPRGLDFANSDLAFRRADMFLGNFNGFNTYDIETPKKPRLLASVVCPGGQGDMSVHGNLLFMSVEQTRGRVDCGTQGVTETASPERFRGVRIFDISDISHPKQIAAVQTCRGSHTHTLVTDPKDKNEHLRLRLGHRARCGRATSSRAARARIPTRIRTPRSSAST